MKHIISLIIFALLGSVLLAQRINTNQNKVNKDIAKVADNIKYDFRKTTWGMSRKQVMKTENLEIDMNVPTLLVYKDAYINSIPAKVGYLFVNDSLVRAKYIFVKEHTNKNDYISDYDNVKGALVKKYGTPKKDDILWSNDLYKDHYQDWGMAVSVGHLSCFAEWETPTTKIISALDGDNFEITLCVEYSSIVLQYLEKRKDDENTKSDF